MLPFFLFISHEGSTAFFHKTGRMAEWYGNCFENRGCPPGHGGSNPSPFSCSKINVQVAQWQSTWLLTRGLKVRVLPCAPQEKPKYKGGNPATPKAGGKVLPLWREV